MSNIAGDCAAIIPESMAIDFVESANVGAAHRLYLERADWIDQQISKAVLGQTSTTDAVVGGLGSGKEHREVQKDIGTADARALAAILNRDLIRPWVQLNHGPRKVYPRLKIERTEQEDLKALSDALAPLIDRGLEVEQATILSRFGLPEAKAGAKMLRPQGAASSDAEAEAPTSKIKRVSAVFKRGQALPGAEAALQATEPLAARKTGGLAQDLLTDRMEIEAAPAMERILGQIEAMVAAATDLGELRQMLLEGFPTIDGAALADVLALGLMATNLHGRIAVVEDAG